jgi:hypothetical protein
MTSEVQIGLLVAVATLLAGAVPALASWAASAQSLRHDRLLRLHEDRKAAYSRFLSAVDELSDALKLCIADPDSPDARDALERARSRLSGANTVVRLTAPPEVDIAAKGLMEAGASHDDDRTHYQRWRAEAKLAQRRFVAAARQDLGYGDMTDVDGPSPVATGSPRATQSLQEPG